VIALLKKYVAQTLHILLVELAIARR